MSTRFIQTIFIVCFLAINHTSFAQADSIDIFIQHEMQERKIPGLQLAIVQKGKIIKTGNYGLANVQDSIPVSDKTVFNINSITKAFTGVAILQLVEAGKLQLSSPVSTYIDNLPEAWDKVTILQMLSHTSGIPDIVDEEESTMILPSAEASWKKVKAMPIDFLPGEKFRYNQTNYLLLGMVIDKVAGMPFQEFIRKEQLQKVGMIKTASSGFGATKEIVPHAAAGYRYSQGKLVNMFFSFPPFLQTAAGMSATAKELAEWIIALQNMQLLKEKSTLAALWTPAKLNNGKTSGFGNLLNGYGSGWPIITRAEHLAAAAVGGGRSAVFVYPNDDLSIIVLTNLAGGSPEAFIDELAGIFIPGMKASNGFGLSPSLKMVKAGLDKSGYKQAIELVSKLKKKNKDFAINENEVNSWGYKLISQKKMDDALEIFKLNVHLFPESANVFDSLGEIYAEIGDATLAIQNYEQSLKLNPQNNNAAVQLKNLRANK